MVSILNAFKSHLAFDDFILEAWLLPLMYPGTPWCRFFVLNLRILVDHGIRVALGCQQIPGLVNGGPHGSSGFAR